MLHVKCEAAVSRKLTTLWAHLDKKAKPHTYFKLRRFCCNSHTYFVYIDKIMAQYIFLLTKICYMHLFFLQLAEEES